MKKILFVCQYFYPETFRGNDVAFHLAEKGHDVHVITGIPNYPAGNFFSGYGFFKKRHDVVRGGGWCSSSSQCRSYTFYRTLRGLGRYPCEADSDS